MRTRIAHAHAPTHTRDLFRSYCHRCNPTPAAPDPMIPASLRPILEAAGRLDPIGDATRRAAFARCKACNATIIRGLDADRCGLAIDADPNRLDSWAETAALLAHRWTGELTVTTRKGDQYGARMQLEHRHRWRIAGKPADRDNTVVLAEHRCGQPLGQPLGRVLPRPASHADTPPF